MRGTRFGIGVLGMLALASPAFGEARGAPEKSAVAGTDGSGGMCIGADAPKRVAACGEGLGTAKGKGSGAPQSRLRQSKRKVEELKGFQAKGPSIEIDLATLRNKEKIVLRAEQLLRREISVIGRLIKNTRTNDPRRPDFLLRLAEGWFEFVQVANQNVRKLDDPIHDACDVKKQKGRCNTLRTQQKEAEKKLNGVREQNIKTLAMLVRDHPKFKKMDEVLFSLGFSLEEMKQYDRARQVYHRLIKSYPESTYIPNAYLSFAEFYFQQGDMKGALQFYEKVTEIPPERNRAYGYAVYKQAWCRYNLEDFKGALQSFIETIEFGEKDAEAPNIKNLVKQSRKELVMPYAQVGNPSRALEFFSRYAENDAQAYEMFESLGELYYDTGQWPEVIAVYHRLMADKTESEKVCYWQTRVTSAVVSSRPKKDQVTEIERTIDLWEHFKNGTQKEETKKECKQVAASVLIDLATAWHRESIGTDTQPGTNDRNTMDLAAKLYRLLLKAFPDMEAMQFPDIDKRDWPTEYKVSYYYAELLWKMENWAQCGPAFDHVLEVDPKGKFTEDAAYASVLCYNKQYQLSYQKDETVVKHRDDDKKKKGKKADEPSRDELVAQYRAKKFSPLEEGMLRAYQRYICFVPDSEELPAIKYREARIFYESNHFEEAAVLFRDIAFNHVESALSVFAANLYLDSLNVIGSYSEPSRPQCYDEMNDNIEPLYGLYCKTEEARAEHEALCTVIEQLRCDLLRKKAEAFESQKAFKKAAQVYVRVFRMYRECGRLDEVLYNAAINFEGARLLGRAIKVRKVLIEKYPEGEWAKRAIYLVGANFHALAMYDLAAEYYEQFAKKYPGELGAECTDAEKTAGTCTNAKDALQNATFFRLGLGDEEKAKENADLFDKNYRKRAPQEASQVRYSLGSVYERQKDWQKVIGHYSSFVKQYRTTALPHELIQANVIVGRAYLTLNDNKKAQPYFAAAVKEWQKSKGGFAQLEVPDDQKDRYLAYAKIAAGEALFNSAGAEFGKYAAIKFPLFKTKATKSNKEEKLKELQEKFTEWMQGDFMKWLETKKAALDGAQKAYEAIAELQVPQWDIAAATRIGDMYLALVNEFREAPVPPVLADDEELVSIYYQGLDEASKPWVEKAKSAYEFCLITATKVRWFNEYMTRCEEELFKLDPRAYPRAAELRGSDVYTYSIHAVPDRLDLVTEAEEGIEGEEDE